MKTKTFKNKLKKQSRKKTRPPRCVGSYLSLFLLFTFFSSSLLFFFSSLLLCSHMIGADTSGFTACTWKCHVESVNWATEHFLWEHEQIAETNVTLKENVILEARSCDIDVPCPLQLGLWWFLAPSTSLANS